MKKCKPFIFYLLAILLGLGGIELACWSVQQLYPEPGPPAGIEGNSCYQFDPFLAYRFVPGSTYESLAIGPDGFVSNQVPALAVPRTAPPGTFRIIMLGGSTVAGSRAGANAQTIPAQLEELLNAGAPAGRRYEVINAGVGGYTAYQATAYYLSSLYRYHPALLIFYDGFNDAAYALDWGGYADAGTQACAPQNYQRYALQLQQRLPALTDDRPRVLNADRLCATTRLMARLKHRLFPAPPPTPVRPAPEAAAELYLEQVRQRLAYCRGNRLPVLNVLQPILIHKPNLSAEEQTITYARLLSREALERYYRVARDGFARLPAGDGNDATTLWRDDGAWHYRDICHTGGDGNRLIAAYLAGLVRSLPAP